MQKGVKNPFAAEKLNTNGGALRKCRNRNGKPERDGNQGNYPPFYCADMRFIAEYVLSGAPRFLCGALRLVFPKKRNVNESGTGI